MSLLKSVEKFCLRQGLDRTYWLAFSGGLDSHVLLHLLVSLRATYPIKLRAIHINHSLSPNAPQWAAHCATVCAALAVAFQVHTIDATSARGESPEEKARECRYAIFADQLALNDLLFTAQHQDDQAETVLLQLLRGAGPKGLSAMPPIKQLGKGFQVRPLLDFTRADLQTYAKENHLQWIEDESNTNVNFSRNYIRHQVMPVLKQRWPSVAITLSRVAANCGEAQQLLESMTKEDLIAIKGSQPKTLSVQKLLTFDSAKQRQLLRLWLEELVLPIPSAVKIQQIQQDFLLSRSDKNPQMVWKGVTLRRFRDNLYAMPCLTKHDPKQIILWDMKNDLLVPGVGKLSITSSVGCGLKKDLSAITIRFRQGGEVIQQAGRHCHHHLKNLFNTWQIPPWQRDRVPLIYVGETLAAVVGFTFSADFVAKEQDAGNVISLEDILPS